MKLSALAFGLTLAFTQQVFAASNSDSILSLTVIGQHQTGIFDDGASEIVAYDAENKRIFKVNAAAATVEVLDIKNPSSPTLLNTIDVTAYGASANSVAVQNGIVAVAVEAENKQENGNVVFYYANSLEYIAHAQVGALPDMVKFTPNGKYLLVANEGEPNDDYTVDPEGSISIINLHQRTLRTVNFKHLNGKENTLRAQGIRIYGPGATAAQDLEPEYIAVSNDSKLAWVSFQEANAAAAIDIANAKLIGIKSLGTKDHSLPQNALDVSNKDDAINIANWPIKGMFMPDSIDSYTYKGRNFIVSANEGDSRDYAGFSEEVRVKDLTLDPTAFPNANTLQKSSNLGRLKTTLVNGDIDGDGDFDEIYSYGARSFSIWSETGELVFDSGSDFERITAEADADNFNSTNDENNSFDDRSDDKGPEPEGLAIGKIKGHTYAFIGLERVGGIMVYDITNPYKTHFVNYINNRNFDVEAKLADGTTNPDVGDLAPEGLVFIPADKSPNHKPLLVVGNEVSGTTTIYEIDVKRTQSHPSRKSR